METKFIPVQIENKYLLLGCVFNTLASEPVKQGVTHQQAIDVLREKHNIVIESPRLQKYGKWKCVIKSIAGDVSTYIGFTKEHADYYGAYNEALTQALLFI